MCISSHGALNPRKPLGKVGPKPYDRGKYDVDKVLKFKTLDLKLVLTEVDKIINSTGVDMNLLENELKYGESDIPNQWHQIWFGCTREFTWEMLITIFGLVRFSDFGHLWFHTDCEPINSEFWLLAKCILAEKLTIVKLLEPPKTIFGRKLHAVHHKSDVYRLAILIKYGGVYIDDDIVAFRELKDLYKEKRVILAIESGMSISNGYIMSPKQSNFMLFWLQEYREFTSVGSGLNKWGRFSVLNPWALHKQLGNDYVKTFNGDMVRPAWYEHDKMFRGYYNWSESYNIHLSPRAWWKYKVKRYNASLVDFVTEDNTLGEVYRHVVLGDKRLLC